MAGIWRLLVVANPSIESDAARDAIVERAAAGPVHVTLVGPSPVGGGPLCAPRAANDTVERLGQASVERLERAASHLAAAGVVVDAIVDEQLDPREARQAWDPSRFDEVVVSCVPWLSFTTSRGVHRSAAA